MHYITAPGPDPGAVWCNERLHYGLGKHADIVDGAKQPGMAHHAAGSVAVFIMDRTHDQTAVSTYFGCDGGKWNCGWALAIDKACVR